GTRVGGGGGRAADRVAGRRAECVIAFDVDAVARVPQGDRAAGVGAEVVPLHHIPGRALEAEEHARAPVAGDDVAGAGRGAADGVAGGPEHHPDAVRGVADRGGAGDVGADVIPLHHVAAPAPAAGADAPAP